MIPQKVKEHLEEYINQEVYVQISVIQGKEKVTTKTAINKYLDSNHFKDLSEGRPYDHFIDGLRDKCLGKLKNSPMRNTKTDDPIILELQKKLNTLSNKELEDTFWEIETGEFLSGSQIKELENDQNYLITKLGLCKKNKNNDEAYQIIINFCINYEKICQIKYPDAPLPLEILKLVN